MERTPFRLPGTWVIATAAAIYRILPPAGSVSWFTVAAVTTWAILGALADLALNGRWRHGRRLHRHPVSIVRPLLGAFAAPSSAPWPPS